jgi:DNA-binding transcriptional ArsR family regulator
MVSREFDYTGAELVRKTGLTPKTVSKELENLVDRGILKVTRTVGRSKMYGLNNSPEVDLLLQYSDIIIKKALKKLENHKE